MAVLVDTSVWSLLFRKNGPAPEPQVTELQRLLRGDDLVATTGVIAQELFYGLGASADAERVARAFRALRYLAPTLDQHIAAARLRRDLRTTGIQVSSADALIAHLAATHDLTLLTTDQDFTHVAAHVPLRLWTP
ncbi:MAG: PIN domain-containing protein [Micrococcales bacterium]|nr:PIN domain-containing protein [Micrococcales bacterium]